MSPVPLNIYKSIVATILLFLTMLVLDKPLIPEMSKSDWFLLIFSGIIGLALADWLFFITLARLGAGLVAIIECLYLPSVIILSTIFLGESLSRGAITGTILVLSAVMIGTFTRNTSQHLIQKEKSSISGILLGCCAMIMVAIGIVCIKETLERSDVLWATLVRLSSGAIFLVVITAFHPQKKQYLNELKFSRTWFYVLPASISANYLALLCWIGGMKYSENASQAAILNQMSTIIIFVLAAIFLGEKITKNKLLAICMAVTGALLSVFW